MEWIQCDEQHLSAVQALYRRTVAYLRATVNYPKWSDEHPSDAGVADAVRKGEQFICLDCGELIGAVIFNSDPEGAYERGNWSIALEPGEFLVIHALATEPGLGRRGVGSFMVEQCIALARQRGCRAIRLDVVPGNLPAERLYKKHGFVCIGTEDLCRGIPEIPVFDLYELNL